MSQARAQAILAALAAQGVHPLRLCADSRQVQPGDLFLAYRGAHADGREFLAQAQARGAVAALVAGERAAMSRETFGGTAPRVAQAGTKETFGWTAPQGEQALPGVPTVEGVAGLPALVVSDLAELAGELAAQVLGHPAQKLWLAGVTGTNGKTSISQWLAQALCALGEPTAVIGTLGNGLYGALHDSANTTPEATQLHAALAEYVALGARCCAMEVSSIGINEGRVNGLPFGVAIFSNLTHDHLDYHGSMEAYGAAKARLFRWPGLRAAVLNVDDAFGRTLAGTLDAATEAWLYCLDAGTAQQMAMAWPGAQIFCPQAVRAEGVGMRFVLNGVDFFVPLVGRFNVSNVLAVLAALCAHGYALTQLPPVLARLAPPPGRMQSLGGVGEPLVVIDYAHTPDALEKALAVLAETAHARGGALSCVFGCGGDRDAGKRPRMGALAQHLADRVIVTSDNPRSEAPDAIIADILAGMRLDSEFRGRPGGPPAALPDVSVEADRGAAIRAAVRGAQSADVILIAGKGHEPYQEIAGVRLPFSDLAVATAALQERAQCPS